MGTRIHTVSRNCKAVLRMAVAVSCIVYERGEADGILPGKLHLYVCMSLLHRHRLMVWKGECNVLSHKCLYDDLFVNKIIGLESVHTRN
jgi:hypothetical protein